MAGLYRKLRQKEHYEFEARLGYTVPGQFGLQCQSGEKHMLGKNEGGSELESPEPTEKPVPQMTRAW